MLASKASPAAGVAPATATAIDPRLNETRISPLSFGAPADGVHDDAPFIRQALAQGGLLDLSNRTWSIQSSITLSSDTWVDMRGANIIADCGSTPVFLFVNASAGLLIEHGAGVVSGTASCFLLAEGSTDQPDGDDKCARLIHLNGLVISSATITTALRFSKAVKSVYLHGCNFYTPNGIDALGKCVEVMVSDSIIYGATGAAGTAGIKLRSSGGGAFYNEGWSFTNCTIDNFAVSHDVTDVFVYTMTGGYAAAAAGGLAFQFQAPTTNLCEELTIGGGAVLGAGIRFAASPGGQAYNARIDALFTGVAGSGVLLENNASNVSIAGKFKSGVGASPVGVVGAGNNSNIVVTGDFDSTFAAGVVLNGSVGTGCAIGPVSGATSGTIAYAARPVLFRSVPVHVKGMADQKQVFSTSNRGGTVYAVGAAIDTLPVSFAKGETGVVVLQLPFGGANAALQNVHVAIPAGMVMPSGTGWSAQDNFLGSASGLLAVRIPYYCTADGAGNVVITNQAGNALAVNNTAYCGVVKDW
jgi:hypothetical protein